jgi:hypothetical protein
MFAASCIRSELVTIVGFPGCCPGSPKKERETRRTPALRNKVYERLAEAQGLAEAKDYVGAAAILR